MLSKVDRIYVPHGEDGGRHVFVDVEGKKKHFADFYNNFAEFHYRQLVEFEDKINKIAEDFAAKYEAIGEAHNELANQVVADISKLERDILDLRAEIYQIRLAIPELPEIPDYRDEISDLQKQISLQNGEIEMLKAVLEGYKPTLRQLLAEYKKQDGLEKLYSVMELMYGEEKHKWGVGDVVFFRNGKSGAINRGKILKVIVRQIIGEGQSENIEYVVSDYGSDSNSSVNKSEILSNSQVFNFFSTNGVEHGQK